MIPPIIHQTYRRKEVPGVFAQYVKSWVKLNPGYEHRLWTDDENDKFVRDHYPQYMDSYLGFRYKIQRIDLVRYMYLHHFGGIYADLDLEPLKPMDALNLDDTTLVLEPTPNALAVNFLIANYWMAAPAQAPFMLAVLEQATKEFIYTNNYRMDVLRSTGCLMLNRIYKDWLTGDKPILLDSHLFSPLTHKEVLCHNKLNPNNDLHKAAYAVHRFAGTWWYC